MNMPTLLDGSEENRSTNMATRTNAVIQYVLCDIIMPLDYYVSCGHIIGFQHKQIIEFFFYANQNRLEVSAEQIYYDLQSNSKTLTGTRNINVTYTIISTHLRRFVGDSIDLHRGQTNRTV